MKLGRLPEKRDPRNLRYATYANVSVIPPSSYWPQILRGRDDWGTLSNDRLGCCTISAAAHSTQVWERRTGDAYKASAQAVADAYLHLTGGADTGLPMLTALRYWRNTGIDGHRIDAYVQLDPIRMHTEIRQAAWLFGTAYIGAWLPLAAKRQWERGEAWTLRGYAESLPEWRPGSWGGHAVNVAGYGADGFVRLITWGRVQLATWAFIKRYVDEAYAMLSADWTDEGRSPTGFDRSRLERDLSNL